MKKSSRFIIALCASVLGIAGLAFIPGCSIDGADSADSDLTVSPSSATLAKGQSQTFTVSGGYEYTWSLSPDDGSGKLNTTKGDSVVYTCLATNIGSAPKKVLVTSTITGTSSGTASTTNTTGTSQYQVSGYAEIFWPASAAASSDVSISGSFSSLSISNEGSRAFSAKGGTPPYDWTVVSGGGSFNPTRTTASGQTTIYTPSSSGSVSIKATDSAANYDTVSINVVP